MIEIVKCLDEAGSLLQGVLEGGAVPREGGAQVVHMVFPRQSICI